LCRLDNAGFFVAELLAVVAGKETDIICVIFHGLHFKVDQRLARKNLWQKKALTLL